MSTRFNLKTIVIVLLVGVVSLAACAPAATPAPPPPTPTNPPAPTEVPPTAMPAPANPPEPTTAPTAAALMAKPVTLQMAGNDQLGKFLADGDGNTLYLFTKDTKGTSNCYDKCATAWPPVLPEGQPTLMNGVDTALISTTVRTDGSVQLTYNGWPLYYYFKDKAPGDTTGQAANEVWWVVSGEGNPIKPATVAITPTEKLGTILVDEDGRTLYMFTKDTKDTSNCYDKCEVAWPPLLQADKPAVGDGVDASLLGTTTRKDGTVQVTYNGLPLYYYFKDAAPGDTTGQGVGSVWYVVAADGKPVDKEEGPDSTY
jgi:predicted lipoprotein with Yx(FWY)xxD motif